MLRNAEQQRKIVLYRSKQNVLATVSLKHAKVYVKPEYLQFSDDENHFWSISFEGSDRDSFLENIPEDDRIAEKSEFSRNIDVLEIEPQQAPEDAPVSTKTSILQRMAKMGKALPTMVSSTPDQSDSSDTDRLPAANVSTPVIHPRRTAYKAAPPKQVSQELVPLTSTPIEQSAVAYMPGYMQPVDNTGLQVFLSENRINNTEMRINISKLEGKIERVLDKMDLLNLSSNADSTVVAKADREDELLDLEEQVLRLKRENRMLRLKIQDLEERIAVHMSTEIDTLKQNQTSSDAQQRKEIERLECMSREQIDTIDQLSKRAKQLESECLEVEAMKQLCIEEHNIEKELQRKALVESEEKIHGLELKQQQNESATDELIKAIMNGLYQKLQEELPKIEVLTLQDVLKIAGGLIKTETKEALRRNANIPNQN